MVPFAGDIMLDIECLGVAPDALILTIGAVGFDPLGQGVIGEACYYNRVDPASQPDRNIDTATVEWWSQQCAEAKEEAFGEADRVSLHKALADLSPLLWKANRIWANGITYDMVILEHAYKSLGIALPWKYYKIMDARTIYKFLPQTWKQSVRQTNNHHALQDCINQVDLLQKGLRYLNIRSIES